MPRNAILGKKGRSPTLKVNGSRRQAETIGGDSDVSAFTVSPRTIFYIYAHIVRAWVSVMDLVGKEPCRLRNRAHVCEDAPLGICGGTFDSSKKKA